MEGSFPTFAPGARGADWPLVRKPLSSQWDSYRRYMVEGTDKPAPRPIDPEKGRETGACATRVGVFLYVTPRGRARAVLTHAWWWAGGGACAGGPRAGEPAEAGGRAGPR